MTTAFTKNTACMIVLVLMITGCEKNYTRYYPDGDSPGLAVFSNNSNNLLTCYIDGKAWRTKDRINPGPTSRTEYELYIRRLRTSGPADTLQFSWDGIYDNNPYENGTIGLVVSIAKNLSLTDFFKAQNGQRLIIDSMMNGYFTTSISRLNTPGFKGNGMIYFNRSSYDSISPDYFKGSLAGLFEADFPTFKITKGRFDHSLWTGMIWDY